MPEIRTGYLIWGEEWGRMQSVGLGLVFPAVFQNLGEVYRVTEYREQLV